MPEAVEQGRAEKGWPKETVDEVEGRPMLACKIPLESDAAGPLILFLSLALDSAHLCSDELGLPYLQARRAHDTAVISAARFCKPPRLFIPLSSSDAGRIFPYLASCTSDMSTIVPNRASQMQTLDIWGGTALAALP